MRRPRGLSFPRWIVKGIRYLIQRDAHPSGSALQGQLSLPSPSALPTLPPTSPLPPAAQPPALSNPPEIVQVSTPTSVREHTMTGVKMEANSNTPPTRNTVTPTTAPATVTTTSYTRSTAAPPPTKHHEYMLHALEMAEIALKSDEVPVGCVFVHNDKIIGKGMNGTNRTLCGTRHAEFVALEKILKNNPPSIFQETDLYVTVEPCIMCASALRQLKIRAVYFGCWNDRFGGCGGVFHIDKDTSIDSPYPCFGGLYREEAIMLLRRFYIQENERAPAPIAKKNRGLKTEIASIEATEGRQLFFEHACVSIAH